MKMNLKLAQNEEKRKGPLKLDAMKCVTGQCAGRMKGFMPY